MTNNTTLDISQKSFAGDFVFFVRLPFRRELSVDSSTKRFMIFQRTKNNKGSFIYCVSSLGGRGFENADI